MIAFTLSKGFLFALLLILLSLSVGARMRAEWNGVVIAESDDIVNVEGNAYFPASALNTNLIQESSTTTVCGWKGMNVLYST
jgi:uncharacterized protein (DUF427 family)